MEKIRQLIEDAESILILSHKSPDGDAVGSALAFYNALLGMYKKVDIIMEDIPKIFEFLPNFDKIKTTSKIQNYDLVIVVDCSTQIRIGQDDNYFENAKYTLNIDHHFSNENYANYNYVSSKSPACSEYLVDVFKYLNVEITKEIAECLIVGILTDTGGFQYSNVTSNTYDFASSVSNLIDIPAIYKNVLSLRTKPQFELMKIAMSRIELLEDDKIAFTYLMEKDFKSVFALAGDHEGIVDIGRNIQGILVSVFIRECENKYRVSLRSNGGVDVNEVAYAFGGGGHKQSAGFDSDLEFDILKEKLINIINLQIK